MNQKITSFNLWILLGPLVIWQLVAGYLYFIFGISEFGTLYRFSLFIIAFFCILNLKNSPQKIVINTLLIFGIYFFLKHLLAGSNYINFYYDVHYFVRGILVFWVFIFFGYNLSYVEIKKFFYRFFVFSFVVISISIIFHYFARLGVGPPDFVHSNRPGYFSYYKEGNVVVPLLVASWFGVLFLVNSQVKKILLTILMLTCGIMTGSKALFVVMFLAGIFYFLTYSGRDNYFDPLVKFPLVGISFFVFLVLVLNGNILIVFSEFYSLLFPGENLAYRVEEWGVLSALASKRNEWALAAFHVFRDYRFSELLLGKDMWSYPNEVAKEIGLSGWKIVESEPVDIFGAFGFFGIFAVYLPIFIVIYFSVYINKKVGSGSENNRYLLALQGGVFSLFLFSTLTGHVVLMPVLSSLLGIMVGAIFKILKCPNQTPKSS